MVRPHNGRNDRSAPTRKEAAEVFYDDDADPALIQSKRVAVIGDGSQGYAQALSQRDSGVDVRGGLTGRITEQDNDYQRSPVRA